MHPADARRCAEHFPAGQGPWSMDAKARECFVERPGVNHCSQYCTDRAQTRPEAFGCISADNGSEVLPFCLVVVSVRSTSLEMGNHFHAFFFRIPRLRTSLTQNETDQSGCRLSAFAELAQRQTFDMHLSPKTYPEKQGRTKNTRLPIKASNQNRPFLKHVQLK